MNKATIKLLVIWEHEIRLAAKLLKIASEHVGEADYPDKLADAINATVAALYGAHDEKYSLVLSSAPSMIRREEIEQEKHE